jgi:hypothetical protein
MLSPDADGHVLIEIGGDSAPRLGLLVGPDQFRPLSVPVGFPVVNEAYLQNPGVWLSLRGGGLALYTASDGVRDAPDGYLRCGRGLLLGERQGRQKPPLRKTA